MTSPAADRLSAALAGRYRIERELGAGGMATVYLAEDLKHDRKVAIKVLKPELAAVLGAERFVVEIKTTAAMSHPHILPLFDSGTADGFLFYVMPYIQGETIREKLNRETQFGVEEAVRIAREVADALDYAHRHGVIHRDIKPENLLLHDGRAMVMDFGIALAVSAAAGGRMTETGLSLGTPHYMSPEQATAEKEITGRSDQYSLASVLYEMLAGDPPFTATAAQAVIMKIITEPAPPVTSRRKNVPANVDAALGKALEKLPADRFESAKAFADALGNPAFSGATAAARGALAGAARPRMRDPVFLAVAAVAVVALAVAGRSMLRSRARVAPVRATRVVLAMPSAQQYSTWSRGALSARPQFALSPDGTTLVYRVLVSAAGDGQLWQRKLNELTASPIPGTEGTDNPRFSMDGEYLAFMAASGGRIGVIPSKGGPATWLSGSVSAMAWGDDGALYFRRRRGFARWVPGTPDAVELAPTVNVGQVSDVLPGSKTILLSAAGVMVGVNLTTGDTTSLGEGSNPRYLSSGHLVFSLPESRTMMIQPFDPASLKLLGPPVSSPDAAGRGYFDVSDDGSLAYQEMTDSAGVRLTWVNKAGLRSPLDWVAAASYDSYALSPRGDKLATATGPQGAQRDIWIYDLQSRARLPITRDGASTRPRWHPTEPRVLFVHSMNGQSSVRSIPADGSGAAEQGVKITPGSSDAQWLPNGKEMVIRMPGASPRNIFRFVPGKDSTPVPFLNRQFQERSPAPSPDGHWLVYTSDQSGQDEIYAQPYPAGGAVIPVSLSGGHSAVWSRDGRELMYVGSDGFMWSARIALGQGTFRVESRTRLFSVEGFVIDQHRPLFDVAPDGRFLMQVPVQAPQGERLVLVRNWAQSLTAKVAKP